MYKKQKIILVFTSIITVPVFASNPPSKVEATEKKETISAPQKEPQPESQAKPQPTMFQEPSEGRLRLGVQNIHKLIASDKAKLHVAKQNYDVYNTFDGDPIANKKLARKYKNEIKILTRRIATHEGMVKTWETDLVEKTGRLTDASS